MRFAFLHGGPGFNSFAEQAILGPIFESDGHSIEFWNEPSRLRPDGDPFEPESAFEAWCASAQRFVVNATGHGRAYLISHSNSVHVASEIARRHTGRIAGLVFIAPSADLFATFTNVLRLAYADLIEAKPEIASTIAGCLTRTRAVLDDAMREGLLNALQDDRIMTHYWADPDQFQASMAACARPDGQFDAESFFAVLSGFGQRGASLLSQGPIAVPALTLFGADDRITPHAEQRSAVLAAIPDAHVAVINDCSHYLHLDRPRQFVDMVVDWALESGR